jgi:hypothetical protein
MVRSPYIFLPIRNGCTPEVVIIIIIISPPLLTAEHKLLPISLDFRQRTSSFHQPSCANRHSTWPEGVLHCVYCDAVSTPELFSSMVVGSTTDMTSPLPFLFFAGSPRFRFDLERNPEHSSFLSPLSDFELLDPPCRGGIIN